MHTVWVRLNAITFFALSVLLGLSIMAGVVKMGHSNHNKPSKSRYCCECCWERVVLNPIQSNPSLSDFESVVSHFFMCFFNSFGFCYVTGSCQ